MVHKKSVFYLSLMLLTMSESVMSENRPVKTRSGLEYTVIKAPEAGAKSPTKGKPVAVHYTGWTESNGQKNVFDSSISRGEPIVFPVGVGYVIKGWDEAILDMKVGEKRTIKIPSELGYGARGVPGTSIMPNATLFFDVELIRAD